MGRPVEPPKATVLEELFLALTGHTGDVFVDAWPRDSPASAPPAAIVVSADLGFISWADREVMNGLLELGHRCRCLEAFVAQEEFAWGREGGSLYRCALANGVQELLDVYGASIVRLQQRLEETPQPSLATVNYYLAEFKVLLPAVHDLVQAVLARGLRGCDILTLLHSQAQCGVPEVQSCAARLQWHCHRVLLKQLQAWVAHGLLEDESREFFIRRCAAPEQPAQAATEPESPGGPHAGAAFDWHRSFEVAAEALPPEVPPPVAAAVLLIGKTVRVLQPSSEGRCATDALGAAPVLARLRDAPAFDAGRFALEIEAIRGKAAERLWRLAVVEGRLLEHLAALRGYFLLGRGDFWQAFLQESHAQMSSAPVRATALRDLQQALARAGAGSSAAADPHFARLRLGLQAPQPADAGPPGTAQSWLPTSLAPAARSAEAPASSARLVTPALHIAAARPPASAAATGLTLPGAFADGVSPRITPQTTNPRAGKGKRGLKVPECDPDWDPLALDYRVQWPLHLLLSAEAMVKYGRMFQYLFRLRRLQLALDLGWAAATRSPQRQQQGPGLAAAPRSLPPLWQVRHHMAHFLANLQLYIQVDVIEVQHARLLRSLAEGRDLTAATRAHDAFLAACIVQSCLDVPMFAMLLSRLLAACRLLAAHLQATAAAAAPPPYPAKAVDDFRRNSRLLFRLLSTPSMQSRARAPFLRQLLLRLDFNGWVQADTERHAMAPPPPPALPLQTA